VRALGAVAVALLAASFVVLTAAAASGAARHPLARRAPSGPPLGGARTLAAEEDEQSSGVPSAAGDQLVENGFSSPLCKGKLAGGLSAATRVDCRVSGFAAAAAPTNDYAIDVHIDTGPVGLGKGGLLSVIQDVFVAPVWGAIGWTVHALLVLLEWCYALELLGGGTSGAAAAALEHARAGFTDPWLALALSVAALLALYHGLVRRRVADTLGGAATTLAMMVGGLWAIADPAGTVGAIGRWADQASLGALAATASGSPGSGAATLGQSMRELYLGAIETPWCYMEFGNVRWCGDPALLEPRLRSAAFALVAHGHGRDLPAASADLVRAATTNGALFLAFPANGPARNSINDKGSLLSAICRSKDATKCSGPAASEAEFRTDGGTMPRVLGLLAIAVGVLGMALLFGLLALRMLAASFLGLFLLLLAPFAVLAPAFGDGGRAVFAGWLTRLLGAVSSKLLFSFVLGTLLTTQRMLVALDSLGWWTQWLLLSAFWWIVFLRRHQVAGLLRGAAAARRGPSSSEGARAAPAKATRTGANARRGGRVERTLQTYATIRHPKRWTTARMSSRLAPAEPRIEQDDGERSRRKAEGGDEDRRSPSAELTGADGQVSPPALAGKDEASRAEGKRRGDPAGEAASSEEGGEELKASKGDGHFGRVLAQRAPSPSEAATRTGDSSSQPPAQPRESRPARSTPDDARPGEASETVRPGALEPSGTADSPAPDVIAEHRGRAAPAARSRIMEDAFAVAERRKRQLGFEPES
jgi:hypothetical protein